MKKLAALGLAGLAAAMLTVACGSASADKWDHNGSQPHMFGSWSHPSGSWPHPSGPGPGSWPHPGPGPSSWPHNGGQSWNHGNHPHRWGRPRFYGGGPGPYYDYGDDYYDDDYYDYPSYPIYDDAHVRWCASHYRTYNPTTDMFFIRAGVTARCIAPFDGR